MMRETLNVTSKRFNRMEVTTENTLKRKLPSFETFRRKLASNPVSSQVIAQQLSEDPRKKKKKRKTKAKNDANDMIISFRPLGNCKLKDSKDSKNIPLELEDQFCKVCPIKF